jgi:hypothetical protein
MGAPLVLAVGVDLFRLCSFLDCGSPPKDDLQKLRKTMLQHIQSLLITFNVHI